MEKEETNPNHELDLGLIQKYGFLSNNETPLSKTDFLTAEKVNICQDIASDLFNKNDPNLSPIAK